MIKKLLRRVVYRAAIYLRESDHLPQSVSENSPHPDAPLATNQFVLDDQSDISVTGPVSALVSPQWFEPTHLKDQRRSLALAVGEELRINPVLQIPNDASLMVRYASAQPVLGDEGLQIDIILRDPKDSDLAPVVLAKLVIAGGIQPQSWSRVTLDLARQANTSSLLTLRCTSMSSKDARRDRVAIADLVVGRTDLLPLLCARTFRNLRIRNETEHFRAAYKHEMYAKVHNRQAQNVEADSRPIRKLSTTDTNTHSDTRKFEFTELSPQGGEVAFEYAARLLGANLRQEPPDFVDRLRQRSTKNEKVRVLSLCSGAARIEAGYSATVPTNVDWCLLDINDDLLQVAASQFPSSVNLDLINADANCLSYTGEQWDVIMCVSGLHHLVELERILRFVYQSLAPGGEFWSIGECVGRNGNRLWPDARDAANAIFAKLPEQYRKNCHTGLVDDYLPDNDYSVGCFEGIRSEDIEPLLDRWFLPADVYRRNCFLWRLTNLAYSDNYELTSEDDVTLIQDMVKQEVLYLEKGGLGTELYGVYRPRVF